MSQLRPAQWSALAILLVSALVANESAARVTSTVTNADAAGKQVSRFDVAGNAIDAHDGTLVRFGDSFYLYGTSYACGYEYQKNSTFCGFKVYSSPDLVHFTDRGSVVPASTCQYCFRPHVIFSPTTKQYVLWSDAGGVYHVFTSPSPTGPFTKQPDPTLAIGGAVDESLFVDDDGAGYLIHNTTLVDPGLTADMVVEKLSPDYLTTTGEKVRLGLGDVEAFTVFKRAGVYHALMSDPSCAYCSGGTGEMVASAMLGPWTGAFYDPDGVHQSGRPEPRQRARLVNANNCGGQPLTVLPVSLQGGDTGYYFVSDRWNGAPNESLANFFIGPMSFDAGGVLQTIDCVNEFTAALEQGEAGELDTSAERDQSSGFAGFHHYCDIAGNVVREQSFTPSRSNELTALSITTFQSGHPDAPLLLELLDEDGAVLKSTSVAVATLSWAPQVVVMEPHRQVLAGHSYSVRLHSATTSGCYGFEYSDTDPYAGGGESFSVDAGATFSPEVKRDLKFTTDVRQNPDEAGGAGGESEAGGVPTTPSGGAATAGLAGTVGIASAGAALGGIGSGTTNAGRAGSVAAPSSADGSGCGCRMTAGREGMNSAGTWLFLLGVLALGGRQRCWSKP